MNTIVPISPVIPIIRSRVNVDLFKRDEPKKTVVNTNYGTSGYYVPTKEECHSSKQTSCNYVWGGLAISDPTREFVLVCPSICATEETASKKTKPIERVSIEDTPWYKKVLRRLKSVFVDTEESYCKELPKYQK